MSKVNLLKIKEIADAKKVTLQSIADAAGITPTGLSRLMRENSTKVETIQRIADFLDVPVTEFFTEECYHVATNSNTGTVGGNFSVGSDMTKVLDILDTQLKAKDEQINGLIRALNK